MLPLVVVAFATAACADDGRDLQDARAWQTTTTRPAPPTSAPPEEPGVTGAVLSSPEFAPGDIAPTDLTCAGANRSPALEWSGIPDDVDELAITLTDQTDPAEPLLLWLVAGIDPATPGMAAGVLTGDAVVTLNDYGQAGWGNPCLDTLAGGTRDLQFRLYLLAESSGLGAGSPGNEAWDQVAASAVDSASLLVRVDGQP